MLVALEAQDAALEDQDAALVASEAMALAMVTDQAMVDMVEEAIIEWGTDKTSLKQAEIAIAVPKT